MLSYGVTRTRRDAGRWLARRMATPEPRLRPTTTTLGCSAWTLSNSARASLWNASSEGDRVAGWIDDHGDGSGAVELLGPRQAGRGDVEPGDAARSDVRRWSLGSRRIELSGHQSRGQDHRQNRVPHRCSPASGREVEPHGNPWTAAAVTIKLGTPRR